MIISIIVAVAENGVIGHDNKLIWHLPEDLKNFKRITSGHHIIMGRKTFESIGKPLPNRVNIIITRNQDYHHDGCSVVHSLSQALDKARKSDESEVFIIGGGRIYQESLLIADKIYYTQVKASFKGDTVFPELNKNEWDVSQKTDYEIDEKHKYTFSILEMKRNK